MVALGRFVLQYGARMIRLALCLGLLVTTLASAQPAGPSSTGINGSILKMFGEVKSFSAKGDIHMINSSGTEVSSMPLTMSMLEGKLRVDMDLSGMKNGTIPPNGMAMLKATGMDRMEMLISPETKGTMVIYPGLESYATVADESLREGKTEKTDLGKETVDGHPCTKRKVTETKASGTPDEALLWVAEDLKDFPVKMEMKQKKNTIRIHFGSVTLAKPDAKLFEIPAGFTKYDSLQGLMQAAMVKMIGGGK